MPIHKTIKVLDIYLDTENARHNVIADQASIMEYLISKENVKKLAEDIAIPSYFTLIGFVMLFDLLLY